MARRSTTWASTNSGRVVPAGASSAPTASAVGWPIPGSQVVELATVSDATRSPWSIASHWATIPPSEAPTTWARWTSRASSSPTASAARSLTEYGGAASPVPKAESTASIGSPDVATFVERPTSRWS
ncbi:MAG: hypothetical protein R2702_11200 [Acidimicrobiales bacterium]